MSEQSLFCRKCGTPSAAGDVYCARCGAKLSAPTTLAQQPESAQAVPSPGAPRQLPAPDGPTPGLLIAGVIVIALALVFAAKGIVLPDTGGTIERTSTDSSGTPASDTHGFLNYVVFMEHVNTSRVSHQEKMAAILAAYKAGGLSGASYAAGTFGGWAAMETAWLDANPPAPCYSDLHRHWRAVVAAGAAAATAIIAGDEVTVMLRIDESSVALELATADLDRVSCSVP